MGETVSDYLYTVVGTIIFLAALGFFLVYLNTLSVFNRKEIESQRSKASITMDTTYGYSEEHVFVKGSSVFTDIYSKDPSIPIYLNGTLLSPEYLKNLRENQKSVMNDLKTRLQMEDRYLIFYTYTSENKIESVQYVHQ